MQSPVCHFGRILHAERLQGDCKPYVGQLDHSQQGIYYYFKPSAEFDTLQVSAASRGFSDTGHKIAEYVLGEALFLPKPRSFLETIFRQWALKDGPLTHQLRIEQYPPNCDETDKADIENDLMFIIAGFEEDEDLQRLVPRDEKPPWKWFFQDPTPPKLENLPQHGMGGDH